jgi:hypothetical protein
LPAVGERHDCDAIALGHACDTGTGRDHIARELMPEDLWVLRTRQRMWLCRRDDRTGHVLVQVGAADPTRRDPNYDLTGVGFGRSRDLLDAQIVSGVETEGAH